MAIQLKKGSSISLKKEAPGLTKVMMGLGWDMATTSARKNLFSFLKPSTTVDLDSSVLCLDSRGKLKNNKDLVYYGNLTHNSGAIAHQGDNLTGKGDGDDEQIIVDLDKVPAKLTTLLFVVNIYNGKERNQDFGSVRNAFVRLVDIKTNREIAYYKLSGDTYQGSNGLLMAELSLEANGWQMKAIGEGFAVQDLNDLALSYR
ncbi:MAG: TerD family protein [Limnothrix sp.]